MHGPDIKRFYTEGAVKELVHLDHKQPEEEARLKSRMLRDGYTPVLDIAPLVGVNYDEVKQTYKYVITVYGVKVEDAWVADGWLNGEVVIAHSNEMFNRIARRERNGSDGDNQSGFLRTRPSEGDAR